MSTFTVIAGVTRSLANVLKNATSLNVEYQKSPDEVEFEQPLIHLYLYRVELNPFFANNAPIRVSSGELRKPPIGINLHYLMTPYGGDEIQIQLTLGEVIQVLQDTPIIPPADYDPSLTEITEELRVVQQPLTLAEMAELWQAFKNRSYRLSLSYEVSVALIDSDQVQSVIPVRERSVDVRKL